MILTSWEASRIRLRSHDKWNPNEPLHNPALKSLRWWSINFDSLYEAESNKDAMIGIVRAVWGITSSCTSLPISFGWFWLIHGSLTLLELFMPVPLHSLEETCTTGNAKNLENLTPLNFSIWLIKWHGFTWLRYPRLRVNQPCFIRFQPPKIKILLKLILPQAPVPVYRYIVFWTHTGGCETE